MGTRDSKTKMSSPLSNGKPPFKRSAAGQFLNDVFRAAVSGKIARGEGVAIVEKPTPRVTVERALAMIRDKSYANGALWNLTTPEERAEIEAALTAIERGGPAKADALIERAMKLASTALARIEGAR